MTRLFGGMFQAVIRNARRQLPATLHGTCDLDTLNREFAVIYFVAAP